jgi:hypothetical protein
LETKIWHSAFYFILSYFLSLAKIRQKEKLKIQISKNEVILEGFIS